MKERIHLVQDYKCMNSRCEAEDHLKVFQGESVPVLVNCWKCGGGRGLEIGEMAAQSRGMRAQGKPHEY